MARIALLLAIIILGYLFWKKLNSCPPKQRQKLLLRSGFFLLLIVILLLVATGRIHWIAVAVTAALPVIKILFNLLLRAIPFLQVWLRNRQTPTKNTPLYKHGINRRGGLATIGPSTWCQQRRYHSVPQTADTKTSP